MLLQILVDLGGELVGLVARLDQLAALDVFVLKRSASAMRLISSSETARGRMRIDCSLAVFCPGRDMVDAVSVDVERDLDLRHAAQRRRNAVEIKQPSILMSAAISLALVTLIVTARWLSSAVENTCDFLVGRGVAVDQAREDAAERAMPSDSGVTSSSSTSLTSPEHTGWMAAPIGRPREVDPCAAPCRTAS